MVVFESVPTKCVWAQQHLAFRIIEIVNCHHVGQVFQIALMHDTAARWHNPKP